MIYHFIPCKICQCCFFIPSFGSKHPNSIKVWKRKNHCLPVFSPFPAMVLSLLSSGSLKLGIVGSKVKVVFRQTGFHGSIIRRRVPGVLPHRGSPLLTEHVIDTDR